MPTLLLEQNAVPGLDQPAARARRERGGGDVRVDGVVLRKEGVRRGNPVRPEFLSTIPTRQRGADGAAEGSDLWRLSGRARDQRGHGGGSAAAGSRRLRAGHHASDRRARSGDGPRRLPRARASRPASSRSSTTWIGEMKHADLVVCRAGATTLAELTAAGTAGDSRFRCRPRPTITSARTPRCSSAPARRS